MKKMLTLIVAMTIATLSFVSHVNAEEYHTVYFNYNGLSERVEVLDGDTIIPIADPVREGFTFYRWKDNKTQNVFDFTTPITEDVVLIAQWKRNEKTDLGSVVEGEKNQEDIIGFNPNEEFGLTPEKVKINLLERLDLITIGIISFGMVISICFAVIYNKEKKSDRAKPTKKKQILRKGKCHKCGAEYSEEDTECKNCGAIIFRD